MSKRAKIISAVVVVVAIGVSVAWSQIRTRVVEEMDRQIGLMAARGVAVTCKDRTVYGFPFRIELACADPGLTAKDGTTVSAKALRAVTLLYNPFLVIVELDGPFTLRRPDGVAVDASWKVLQASIRLGSSGPERVSIAADDLDIAASGGDRPPVKLVAAHGELHARHAADATGPFDADLAAQFDRATLTEAAKPLGPEKLDITLDATVLGVPAPGAPEPGKAWAANGGKVELRNLSLVTPKEMKVEGTGSFGPRPDGLVDGRIRLTASGLERVASGGKLSPELAAVATGFLFMGAPVETGDKRGRALDLVIEQGRLKLGKMALGTLPAVYNP